MSTLTRNDGTQFVMQTYRELLTQQRKAPLVQQICSLSEQHGQFVRLFKRQGAQYDAVFSADSGYLLGESVKHYFGQLNSLIFCEALPDSHQAILVVIRDGSVYLDTLIPTNALYEELLPLMTGKHPFHIFTSGDLSLKETPGDGHFAFPPELVSSFETLDQPLFPRLPALRSLQLLPLPLALKAEHLSSKSNRIGITIGIVALGLLAWTLFPSEHKATRPKTRTSAVDPYQRYYAALSTPSPTEQLNELAHSLNTLSLIPGWQVDRILFNGKRYHITVTSYGGTLRMLKEWGDKTHWYYEIAPKSATLSHPSEIRGREKPTVIYNNTEVLTVLIDHLHQLVQERSIQLRKTTQRGNAKENELIITIKNGSPELLEAIASTLSGLPVTLSSINMSSRTGYLNGTLYLSAWGA